MYLQNYSCISYIQTSNSGRRLLGKTNNDSLNRKKQLISIHRVKFASLFSHRCHKLPADSYSFDMDTADFYFRSSILQGI